MRAECVRSVVVGTNAVFTRGVLGILELWVSKYSPAGGEFQISASPHLARS